MHQHKNPKEGALGGLAELLPKLITLKEVATLLRRSRESIRRLRRLDPSFPKSIRVGVGDVMRQRILFSRPEIEAWLEAHFDGADLQQTTLEGVTWTGG